MIERTAPCHQCVSAAELVGIYYSHANGSREAVRLSEQHAVPSRQAKNPLGLFTQCHLESVPAPYRSLLAHTNHMTVTVESYYRDSVDVEVLRSHTDSEHYCREILLRTHSSGVVVQYGIVRLRLKFLPEAPRAEILEQKKPLGRVLIEHEVLRKIELFELIKIECGETLANFFSVPVGTFAYGRTAMLYCNNEPAIELLEIVRP